MNSRGVESQLVRSVGSEGNVERGARRPSAGQKGSNTCSGRMQSGWRWSKCDPRGSKRPQKDEQQSLDGTPDPVRTDRAYGNHVLGEFAGGPTSRRGPAPTVSSRPPWTWIPCRFPCSPFALPRASCPSHFSSVLAQGSISSYPRPRLDLSVPGSRTERRPPQAPDRRTVREPSETRPCQLLTRRFGTSEKRYGTVTSPRDERIFDDFHPGPSLWQITIRHVVVRVLRMLRLLRGGGKAQGWASSAWVQLPRCTDPSGGSRKRGKNETCMRLA